ncbi:hypothetical protein [Pseudogemmobacter humi]|uniref:Uncharacterized protein n=1 Tax=Pseudogemmobacter humi TaxID=2483812 RepID=A0A3P5XAR3_9RHOB|nr:hypothetical protein [Pseudogemmobacter humi]VDC31838.1 hypothetical protein XINFAN_03184 [Pseudogemmobacter humi]
MSLLGALPGIGSVLGGLGSLFGGRRRSDPMIDTARALRGQALGAREAAAEHGFNPLTLLGVSSPMAAQGGGGAAPLASIDLITGGLRDISDVVSGDADRRRAADQLKLDMARLEFDQLRSGVVAAAPSAAAAVGDGLPALGRHSNSVRGSMAGSVPLSFGMAPAPLSPEREKSVDPVKNTPGFFEVENSLTGGPVVLPGNDGEVMGIDEGLMATVVGLPQVVSNWSVRGPANDAREEFILKYGVSPREYYFGGGKGKPFKPSKSEKWRNKFNESMRKGH